MNVPFTDEYCHSVDEAEGLWIQCAICKDAKVKVRSDRPFTNTDWLRHKNKSEKHKSNVFNEKERKRMQAKLKSKDLKLSMKEKPKYQQISMATTKMQLYFKPKKKDSSVSSCTNVVSTPKSTSSSTTKATSTASTPPGSAIDYQSVSWLVVRSLFVLRAEAEARAQDKA